MKLLKTSEYEIHIIDLALFIRSAKKDRATKDDVNSLVIADSHMGYEECLHKQGILIQKFQFAEIMKRLQKIFSEIKKNYGIEILDRIIINGDLKHEFGTISEQEWRETLRILDFLSKHAKKIVIVKGNHDTIIGPIAEKRNIEFVDEYKIGKILITHGHKIPSEQILKDSEIIIIGHEHPAVSIREGIRTEIFKCFLVGKWRSKTLIVMPSLCLVTEGTDILKEELLSPFLNKGINLNNFKTFVASEKGIYDFGNLSSIRKMH